MSTATEKKKVVLPCTNAKCGKELEGKTQYYPGNGQRLCEKCYLKDE